MVGNKIRCENGGEWKAREKFSHSALRKYQKKLGNGIATPAQSTISCLEHSSGNKAPEMKCEGPCDRWRELDFFSKSTRRNKVYWCKDCVDWAEKTEVGEALPPPGERICEEEFETLKMRVADFVLNEDYENGIPKGNDSGPATTVSINDFDDDYEEEFTLLPPGDEATTVTDSIASPEDTDVSVETPGAAATSTEPMAPAPRAPHWFLGFMNNDSPSTSSTTPTTLDTLDTLDLLDSLDTPDESISELSITAGSQTHTRTTTTAADTNASATPGQTGAVSFNAWSPEGNFERMIKEPTIATEESGWKTVTRTAKGPRMVTVRPRGKKEKDEVKVGKNGWVKVSNRRTTPQLPNYILANCVRGEEDFVGDIIPDEL
ncbi:hypothetical protein QC763_307860 [Podospora pseudopauciseta]|uniref:Stc1 domain-containing protein n=1 Tax=Podospora pseudopauciseta TaxID=2093780 RepID=A0ABR0HHE7_9PEZI|nr:hypothetical protein QC763_307860 [Podospora pseudopauciseta]